MLFTIQASTSDGVPAGTYRAKFKEVSPLTTKNGNAYRWVFQADDGKTISALSDAENPPTTKNKTGRWLSALSGKPLTAGVSVNPTDYVGRNYLVIVSPAENGKTKLETFSALNN